MQSTHRRPPGGVFVWINRSSDRAFASTALIFYTVFAIIAFPSKNDAQSRRDFPSR
jgi:hypothetical protein